MQKSWYEKTVYRYLAVWAFVLVVTCAGVKIYIHDHYSSYTSAQSWQHAMQRWPYVVAVFVFIAVAQIFGLLLSVASARRLRRQRPAEGALLWYLWGLASACYLLWTLTIPFGILFIFAVQFFAILFSVLAVAGVIVWGIARLRSR